MKVLLLFVMMSVTSTLWAADKPVAAPAASSITGSVLEAKDVESYTYLRLKTAEGEAWAAISKTPIKRGAKVTIENMMVMNNFESRSLKQTFKTIAFGNLACAGAPKSGHANMAHPVTAQPANTADVRVAKAAGLKAWTVAEINTKAQDLKG